MVVEIIFVRHGKTKHNDLGILQGGLDEPLNREGLDDAEELSEYLKEIPFDILISSDLRRALDCARRIAEKTGKEILINPLVRERHMGEHQGKKITDLGYNDLNYPEMVRHLYECDCPNGETNKEMIERIEKFLENVFENYKGKRIIVASHGGVIMLALNHILGEDIKVENARKHKNGYVSYLKFGEDRMLKDKMVAVHVGELISYLNRYDLPHKFLKKIPDKGNSMGIEAYVFDFFGTLITNNIEVYNRLMSESFGLDKQGYKEKLREFLTVKDFLSKDHALDAALNQLGIEFTQEQRKEFFSRIEGWKKSLELYPGALEVMQELKKRGHKIGIVSNHTKFIEGLVEMHGVGEYSDATILSIHAGVSKPHRKMYGLGLKKLEIVDPTKVIMIGDQLEKDVLAPEKEFGMQGILFDPDNKYPEYTGRKIKDLRELL